MIEVSVIIPFLNEEKYIEDCVKALLNQKCDFRYELIFVDNGSTDNSVKLLKPYLRKRQDKLLIEPKGNEYTARNKALRVAKGKILAFTDADSIADKNWLKNITKPISEGADISLGKLVFNPKHSRFIRAFEKYENYKVSYLIKNSLHKYYYGYCDNMAISKQVFSVVKEFKEKPINGDTQIIHEYKERNGDVTVKYASKAIVTHMEISSLKDWTKKLYSYGRQNNLYASKNYYYEPINLKTRFVILFSSLFNNDVNAIDKLIAIPTVAYGYLAYTLGERSS